MTSNLQELKAYIREQELLTRRLIVKNSRKNDYNDIKRQLSETQNREKKERQLRRKYPAVREAYKHYQLTMALVGKK
tara:strand:- start:313 stop:543 length:231 start_codon:yes stop_codon:yes gene_type:complete